MPHTNKYQFNKTLIKNWIDSLRLVQGSVKNLIKQGIT